MQPQKRGQWFTVRETARAWLEDSGVLPADALGEFRTRENTLSVYELQNGRANAARLVAAILAGRQSGLIDHTDCLVFDDAIVQELGIRLIATDGGTPDTLANSFHRDLSDLTASQLTALAERLIRYAELVPFLDQELIEALRAADAAAEIDGKAVGKNIRKQANLG